MTNRILTLTDSLFQAAYTLSSFICFLGLALQEQPLSPPS
jgi:hypothetical protein